MPFLRDFIPHWLQEKLFSSKNRTEVSVGKKLQNDMLPEIEKVHKVVYYLIERLFRLFSLDLQILLLLPRTTYRPFVTFGWDVFFPLEFIGTKMHFCTEEGETAKETA